MNYSLQGGVLLPASAATVPPYTLADLSLALGDIVPFDPKSAYQNAPTGQPILWTFSINFRVLSHLSPGAPVGCLKLYEIDELLHWYKPIPSHAYLVDTCSVVGGVTISNGLASFDGNSHIECAFNLAEWVQLIVGTLDPSDPLYSTLNHFYTDTDVNTGETSPKQLHTYDNFTMVARATVPEGVRAPGGMPIMSYIPAGGPAGPVPRLVVTATVAASGIGFGGCTLPSDFFGELCYWWYDLRKVSVVHVEHTVAKPNYGIDKCGTGEAFNSFEFPIRDATLYIGYDPELERWFEGTIAGVLVDPTDSKPPDL